MLLQYSCPKHPDVPLVPEGQPTSLTFRCGTCGTRYPVIDGIARFMPPSSWQSESTQAEAAQWDSQAASYEERRVGDARYMAGVEAAVRAADPRPGDYVLDAGCGTGLSARRLAATGAHVTALDLSIRSLEFLRDRAGGSMQFAQGDLTHLPFANASFDRVVCANAIQHVEGADCRASCVGELVRVLRPGGFFVLTAQQYSIPRRRAGWTKEGASGDRVRYIHRFTRLELEHLLGAGLTALRVRGAGFPLPRRFKLGTVTWVVEKIWQRLPLGTAWADLLVAVGRKPTLPDGIATRARDARI